MCRLKLYTYLCIYSTAHAIKCISDLYIHIYIYLHIFYYMKIPHYKTIVPIICIWEDSMDTRVLFLPLVKLQVTHPPFNLCEFIP